jgi:predicted membrane protein
MCNKECEICETKCRKGIKTNQNNKKMEQNKTKKHGNRTPTIIFAMLIILFGTIMLLTRSIGWSQMRPVILSGEMLLLIAGIIILANRRIFMGFAFAGAGVFFILPKLATAFPQIVLPADFINNYWGALIIYIGILILLSTIIRYCGGFSGFTHTEHIRHRRGFDKWKWQEYGSEIQKLKYESRSKHNCWFAHSVAFSDNEHIYLEPMFEGGEINVAFGTSKLDLRKTEIEEGVTDIFINVVFGNCTIFIPQNWVVMTGDMNVFGGKIIDKRISLDRQSEGTSAHKLNIVGSVVFSNLDLRN